jgi:quercetin dioxygenase-like cupin family protein
MATPTPHPNPTAAPLDAATLAIIAEGIAAGDPAGFVPAGGSRRWGIAAVNEAYEAWVIAWPAGTGLAMHDHDGSVAAVRVVSGTLRERYRDGDETVVRWLDAGDAHVLATDHVHEVINLHDSEAISVHVYSPPLTDMDFRVDPEIDLRTAPAVGPIATSLETSA